MTGLLAGDEARRDFFVRAQKQVYEAGVAGTPYHEVLGQLLTKSHREYFTPGVQKCLNDEWQRGQTKHWGQDVILSKSAL